MSTKLSYFHDVVRKHRRGVGPTLLRCGLRALSVPYGWATHLRNVCFDRGWKQVHRVPVPVVSVGNLTVGGTGKTPCVETVARYYRERDVRVAILSRGYGAQEGQNDEALVLHDNLPDVPHLQGPDRVALARIALEELESELLILDDGFQHRRLARDLDVVLIDSTDPWGQGHLLPRGLMRESPRSLRRAGVVVLTRCDQSTNVEREQVRRIIARRAPNASVIETVHRPVELINSERETTELKLLQDRPVAAFCGIGNPEAFRRTLSHLGAEVIAFRRFADHHNYQRDDVDDLRRWAHDLPNDCLVITTQKDLVKLRIKEISQRPLWALRIALQGRDAKGTEALAQRLHALAPGRLTTDHTDNTD